MVEVKVKRIISDRSSGRYVLVLEDKTRRALPLSIGLLEAQLIILALKKVHLSPPLFHDFISSLFAELSVKPLRVEIITRRNESYYAQLVIQVSDKIKYVECRPSDGVVLALRCEIPVLVQTDLLETSPSLSIFQNRKRQRTSRLAPLTYEEADRLKEEIEELSPEDFWRRVKGVTER